MLNFHSTERQRLCQEENAQLAWPPRAPKATKIGLRAGWGRTEVLIVIICVCALIVLISTGIYQRRLSARANLCGARQFRVALAHQGFDAEFQRLPGYRDLQAIDVDDQPVACSWVFPILPFLEPLNQPLRIRSGDEVREVRGDELPPMTGQESIIFGGTSLQQLVDQYGPAGSDEFRGRRPQHRIAELICPAAGPDSATNAMNWRANTGLLDHPTTELPADWPQNGVFLDQFSESGPAVAQSLRQIEDGDGVNFTVMLSEGLRPLQWTESEEPSVGIFWAYPLEPNGPTLTDPVSWSLSGVEPELGFSELGLAHTRPSSNHPAGVTVAFCSGATSTISRDIDPVTWAQMMSSTDAGTRLPGTEISIRPETIGFPAAPSTGSSMLTTESP